MKTNIWKLLIIILITISGQSIAQDNTMSISDTAIWYEDEVQPAILLTADYPSADLAEAWQEYLEERYDIEPDAVWVNKTYSMATDWTNISTISPAILNLHTDFKEQEKQSEMVVYVDFGNGYFMNPYVHKDEVEATEQMLSDFMRSFRQETYEKQIAILQERMLVLRDNYEILDNAEEELAVDIQETYLDLFALKVKLQNQQLEQQAYLLELAELDSRLNAERQLIEKVLKHKLESAAKEKGLND